MLFSVTKLCLFEHLPLLSTMHNSVFILLCRKSLTVLAECKIVLAECEIVLAECKILLISECEENQ